MSEGLYPKQNGQIFYSKDANMSYYQGAFSANATTGAVIVNNTETLVLNNNNDRKRVLIRNIGDEVIYLGGVGVGSSDGTALSPGMCIVLNSKTALYGVVTITSSELRYFEVQ